MLEPDGHSPHTAHTTNPVPFVLTAPGYELRDDGELKDVVPSVLGRLGLDPPPEMTGKDLVRSVKPREGSKVRR
jgi:2,3-bisphosphoglycerate-independent phosphoglycerate mutase